MSSSNSSVSPPKPDQKLKTIAVDVEGKTTTNSPKQGSPQEVVSEKAITEVVSEKMITEVVSESATTERSSVGLGVALGEATMMRTPTVLPCDLCDRQFSTYYSLHRHKRTHDHDQELERQFKNMDPIHRRYSKKRLHSYRGTCSRSAFPNGTYLGIGVRNSTFPPPNPEVQAPSLIRDTTYKHPPLPNVDYFLPSFGPFGPLDSREDDVCSNELYRKLINGGLAMADRVGAPRRSSSRDPLRSHSKNPSGLSLDLSLAPPGSNNNNNNRSHGSSSRPRFLAKSFGVINNERGLYPSLNGGVTTGGGRGAIDLNFPACPDLSRCHFHGPSPLDSVARSVPPPPPPTNVSNDAITRNFLQLHPLPPPPTTNVSNDLITTSVPLPPPPTTNVSNVEKGSGSTFLEKLLAKGKNNIVVIEDGDKGKEVTEDHGKGSAGSG